MAELHEQIKNAVDFGTPKPEIPDYILSNLKYPFFDWQKEAFQYLLLNEKRTEGKNEPTHLMFNMATGTGKTLVMASCILHYYKKGYRKFIFFVNQKNIIYKTENNFIDSNHNKYLFADKIVMEDETINIKKVETFSKSNESIEIKLTTIQQLYNDIHIQKENQVLLDDLIKKDIVMLADEAHHLNTDTKKLQGELDLHTELNDKTSEVEIEKKGWEHTVIELLLNKNGKKEDNKNILLEFTATIPEIQKVIDKYTDKTIYKFGLKEFLSAGYTKEINILSSTLEKKERVLQALVFNWYRHKIALKNNLSNWKPVILFRSKTIEESKTDFEEFLIMVKNLKVSDFDFLKNIEEKFTQGEDAYEQGKSRVLDLIKFIKNEGISKSEIINFIRDNFTERNCVITNSKSNKAKTKENIDEDTDKLLNNLEDKDNHIRAIFTVNRLTEGWDVLNLFDIVRLYDGRIDSEGRNGERVFTGTAISEIQLIGRGVRYYPFSYKDKIKNKRKFDENIGCEMRVLEELYYHSDSDHRYISDLKSQLKEKGFIQDNRIEKKFKMKSSFTSTDFFKDVKIWKNEKIENPERKQKTLDYLKETLDLKFDLESLGITEEQIDFDKQDSDTERLNINDVNKRTITKSIKDFEKHIFDKAVNIKSKKQSSLLRFEFLQQEVENIESVEDFRVKLIGDLKIKLVTTKSSFDEITNKEKLSVLLKALDIIFTELKQHINPYKGTEFDAYNLTEFFGEEVRKNVKKDEYSQRLEDELKYEDWYVVDQFYGTSEEKGLIEFMKETIINLKSTYKEVYLLRNEEQYKIYDFEKGRGFQPDFILFLKDKSDLYYQIFIEPKGDNLLEKDEWKNAFLKEITKKYSDKKILKIEGKNYDLIGLPLFNKSNNDEFVKEYVKLIS
ncbi:MAG: DEAD/DEAH box helicase family protein [Candidatus Pacebacteria bacterium]|nr:DEAD/DEAH box helicase family protein [Candidatus Paceibacterota bacterium]